MFGKYNYDKGMKLNDSGEYNNAIDKFNKALKSGDLNEIEIYNAYVLEGSCFIKIGNYDEAIKALNYALQWDKTHYGAYYALGIAYFKKSDYEQSLQYLEKAIELNSDHLESWKFKGLVLEKLEKYNGAETALKTALRCPSSSDSEIIQEINCEIFIIQLKKSNKKAIEFQNNGKYTDAIKVYDSILESIRSNSNTESLDEVNQIRTDSLLNKGLCLKALKRYESAIDAFKEVINLIPDNIPAYVNLVDCYTNLKKFDDALKYCAEAENITDNDEEKNAIDSMKHFIIFCKFLINKDYQGALNEANLVPETNDELIGVKKVITGSCHFYLENYDEALNYLMPYVDADWLDSGTEDNTFRGMANTYVGGVYYKRKNYETALKYLKKCVEMDYNAISETGLFMGECYIALGEYKKAIDALRKAVDAWEETDDYDIPYLESRIEFAKKKLAEEKAKMPPSHITIQGNNNPINLGGILATDDAVINRSVIGKDSAQEENDVCFCPYCGTKINSDFLFCPKCGRKLKED